MTALHSYVLERWHFFVANLRASYFGAFLLFIFLLTEVVAVPFLARYDVIFLAAVCYQALALIFKLEHIREFLVVLIFHVLATGMELFKTNPAVGSWTYPGLGGATFVLGTVPLFSGFLYSAVGSYISRAFTFLNLAFERFPAYHHLWILAALIYINFFTHHYVFDIRYALFVYIFVVFFRTTIRYRVYREEYRLPFVAAALFMAVFVWIAENVGTFSKIWLYPSQIEYWHLVSFSKIGSWFLLLVLSFALVSIIYRDRLRR